MARAALEAARAQNARGQRARRRADIPPGAALKLRRRRWSGPGADAARDPQLIGDALRSFLARAEPDLIRARLVAEWASIVGAEIAEHAEPVSLIDGELTVQAESTAWATQLRLLAPGMAARINEVLGRGTVKRIRTRGPSGPSWRFGTRHVPGRGPRDTYG